MDKQYRMPLAMLFVALLIAGVAEADEVVTNPASGTPEAAISTAFAAALGNDFSKYLDAVHPEHKQTARQKNERQKYEWQRFQKQCRWYLKAENPITYAVVSRREEGSKPSRVVVFIRDQKNKNRMPVPVRLKQHSSGWKIVVSSL
ncbi:MAG: hypothetical protein VX223_16500 [Myxococcota bacterium]|nr:hypothetical protein [Myxococcota bacterium]